MHVDGSAHVEQDGNAEAAPTEVVDDAGVGTPDTSTPESPEAAEPHEAADTQPEPVRYEVVFECRDRMVGSRLIARIIEVTGPTFPVTKGEEGPTWSVSIEFPNPAAADRFFTSDFYRQFCIEARRGANSSVLVVPLGPVDQ